MKLKKLVDILAILVVLTLVVVAIIAVGQHHFAPTETPVGINELRRDELYVRELLDGCTVDEIIEDPDWKANLVDATENYVMVEADKFDFSKEIGVEDGYTNIYFDSETREIELLQHNYVTYTNEIDPKAELENLVGNVQGNITGLLGNPSQSFMLMNTSGEFVDYDGLSVDEMMEKLLEGGHVMYVMYENNGLRYEMNIMYSDDTIYLIVWVFDESDACGDDCEHEH